MGGPLTGVRVVELRGIGPLPFAGMILADFGAEVIRVDRTSARADPAAVSEIEPLGRGRLSVALDLKTPAGREAVLRMCERSDALIEGFRPGVAERMGLGPEDCAARNPRLVYGRMTGWGQAGPLARAAGHDINYISVAGALSLVGRRGQAPVPPMNLVGDYGGGGMLLALGLIAALFEARQSGRGQVVDAAMVDGAALLSTVVHELVHDGSWTEERGSNVLDTGAAYYDAYETADGRYVSIGALEPHFYAELVARLGLDLPRDEVDTDTQRRTLAEVFRTRTQREWCDLLEGTDACFAPVLTPSEAVHHPHNVARGTFVEVGGVPQAAPAPRFSRTQAEVKRPGCPPGAHTRDVLYDCGFTDEEIDRLLATGAAEQR